MYHLCIGFSVAVLTLREYTNMSSKSSFQRGIVKYNNFVGKVNFVMIIYLLVAEGLIQQSVSCGSIGSIKENEPVNLNDKTSTGQVNRQDENSIFYDIGVRGTRESVNPRSRRDLKLLSTDASTKSAINTRIAYEKAINQTLADYYAQRKAVMDRYYARQREISEAFKDNNKSQASGNNSTRIIPVIDKILTTNRPILDYAPEIGQEDINNKIDSARSRGIERERSRSWHPRDLGDELSNNDLQSGTSNRIENTQEASGYYRLGELSHSEDEKIVYQHNLRVGLKGSSQLDATFEAVIDAPFSMTAVEAKPYGNSRANITRISGGPGSNFVKLKVQPHINEGFAYAFQIWAVPK